MDGKLFNRDGDQLSFVVDSMHGKVARFLRILGFDTLYYPDHNIGDEELLRKCEEKGENTALVTGDRALYWRAKKICKNTVYLKPGTRVEVAILVLSLKFKIEPEIDKNTTRCPYCNTLLIKAESDALPWVRGAIYICPSCGNYYWEGKHWIGIRKIVSRVEEWMRSRWSRKNLR